MWKRRDSRDVVFVVVVVIAIVFAFRDTGHKQAADVQASVGAASRVLLSMLFSLLFVVVVAVVLDMGHRWTAKV